MNTAPRAESSREFLTAIRVGDIWGGIVAGVTRSGTAVLLDGFPAQPLGVVGALDRSWGRFPGTGISDGDRISAEVIGVDPERGVVRLSTAATENPELWAFLKNLRTGQRLSGEVASIETFGVFVALDDGPGHPVFPGVGFISVAELAWPRFEAISDVVTVGERITCEFLQFDTTNGEARLSLRATRPDPFQEFADRTHAGQRLRGRVTKLIPFGFFVEIAPGIEGLVHRDETVPTPAGTWDEAVRVGDGTTVVVVEVDRERRRIRLSSRLAHTPGPTAPAAPSRPLKPR
ncbi:S1 RNA-binding domain-containing protein [Streptomyces sp. NPDC004111]|uniref:S1 RNA-binding domain-containing protein n=1 Tax=Streptomyces sp. NPDC004111 TaxID=3364690 RepID=UPI0036C8D41E